MKKMIVIAGLTLAGCASVPDVSVRYYPPVTTVTAKVTQTVTCDESDQLILARTTDLTPTHAADTDSPFLFDLERLEGFLSDTSFTMELTEDGRLKGINATSKGQAGEVIKTGVELLVTKLGALNPTKFTEECDLINKSKVDEAGKPVRTDTLTLVYEGAAPGAPNAAGNVLVLTTVLSEDYSGILSLIGTPKISTGNAGFIEPAIDQASVSETAYPTLELRQLSAMKYSVSIEGGIPLFNDPEAYSQTIRVALSSAGTYKVPVPKSAAFGNTAFELAVSEAGAVTKLSYGADTGAGSMIGIGGAFRDYEEDPTTAERAAEIKAEADLIAQQARLVRCQADPKSCT